MPLQGSDDIQAHDMERIDIERIARYFRADGQFGPLSVDQIADLLKQARQLAARPGEIIYKEGDEERDHLLLLSGKIEAQRVWSARGAYDQSYTWELDPSQCEANFAFLSASSRVRVRAVSAISFLQISADKVDELVGWDQHFSDELENDSELSRRMQLVKQVGVFHHVPLKSVITAFRKMVSMEVAPGETIIKQGDEGDSYYLIDSGEAEVIRTDPLTDETVCVGTLGPGDAFGEEALLQEGYRNATVNMVTPSRLLKLDKASFDELLKPSVVREVTPDHALELVRNGGAKWLDCRYAKEYEDSRIPGTSFAPLDQIRSNVLKLDPDKTYVVYCRSGRRSKAAAFLLRERHINAVSLLGGIKSWPYEVDATPPVSVNPSASGQ